MSSSFSIFSGFTLYCVTISTIFLFPIFSFFGKPCFTVLCRILLKWIACCGIVLNRLHSLGSFYSEKIQKIHEYPAGCDTNQKTAVPYSVIFCGENGAGIVERAESSGDIERSGCKNCGVFCAECNGNISGNSRDSVEEIPFRVMCNSNVFAPDILRNSACLSYD